MNNQLEMYPFVAGYKEKDGASQLAAKKQNKNQNNRRRQLALSLFKAHPGGLTADEIAVMLDENILAIRPRVSELRAQGKIESTGQRRKSNHGNASTVWRLSYVRA